LGGRRRRRIAHAVREFARTLPAPHVTVRNARLLRLLGFTVGDATGTIHLARADCRVDVMRLPAAARPIGTGQPVREVTMSVLSWARVACWRLVGKL
jgi:hypothetical protein